MKEPQKKIDEFNYATLTDWTEAARKELDGDDPWKKLTYSGNEWQLKPYYADSPENRPSPLLDESENIFLGARTWYNCPHVLVRDEKKANEEALRYLQGGAEGIFFELNAETNFRILLKEIQWQFCSLNFLARNNSGVIGDALAGFLSEKKTGDTLHGAFFGNTSRRTPLVPGFRFSGVAVATAGSPVDELVSAFATMSKVYDGDFSGHARSAAVSLPLGQDFLLEIAKLRAARIIWQRIFAERSAPAPLVIHSLSEPLTGDAFQPHGNMLKGSVAAMAAILGGCDVLTIKPENPGHAMMSRVAMRISNVLREEAHFSKVADPIAGAWAIEDLTRQLADSAWLSIKNVKST